MKRDTFAFLTEMPGNRVTPEQLEMITCRYLWAGGLSKGKDVLEVACGPGLGLGYLSSMARTVLAGDYDPDCVRQCGEHYRGQPPIVRFDAQFMPFRDGSFDVVILFEAIYYVPDVSLFLSESRRVLRPGGIVLLALPNRDWPGFCPSPQSHRYFSPPELIASCEAQGFRAEVFGAYPQVGVSRSQKFLRFIRRTSTKLGLVPQSHSRTEFVRGLLKRFFLGELERVPAAILPESAAGECSQVPVPSDRIDRVHRVLYAVARVDDTVPKVESERNQNAE